MTRYDRFVLQRRGEPGVVATVPAVRGETLYEALERTGHPIRTTCRGSTICGLCGVHVEEGGEQLEPAAPDEQVLLEREQAGPDERLACRLRIPEGASKLVVSTRYWRKR
ncbi:MAG: (2Fe-2S)-binding protein [Alphaproteobacteria bacterium]|nr:(2Fe-2S)-binding protein [Alphaproteobacteria bacterium]